jgi:alpha-glucosidase (family GH31 glycosyl hydrolase)
VEKGAAIRRVYLPRGSWYDFWTNERIEGGRETRRDVDLEIIPLYVRAGSILPLGPVKRYTAEEVDQALTVLIYSGADTSFLLYEDDGISFNHRKGEWMGIQMTWNDAHRSLALELTPGSRMLTPVRNMEIRMGQEIRSVRFDGTPIKILF